MTSEVAQIAVRVEDDAGGVLLSQVFELDPEHQDASELEFNPRPSTIRTFTPRGVSAQWDYTPSEGENHSQKTEDVLIRLLEGEKFDLWYQS